MSISMLKRKPSVEKISPERTELAEAVAYATSAQARRNAALAAEEAVRSNVYRTQVAIEEAEAALLEIRTEATKQTVAGLMGEAVEAPVNIQAAREAVVQAKLAREDAIAARDLLNSRRQGDDMTLSGSGWKLDAAVDAVVKSEALKHATFLADKVMRLQREVAIAHDELQWLYDARVFPEAEDYRGTYPRPADENVLAAVRRMDPQWRDYNWTDLVPTPRPSDTWKAWRAALRADASVEPPAGKETP